MVDLVSKLGLCAYPAHSVISRRRSPSLAKAWCSIHQNGPTGRDRRYRMNGTIMQSHTLTTTLVTTPSRAKIVIGLLGLRPSENDSFQRMTLLVKLIGIHNDTRSYHPRMSFIVAVMLRFSTCGLFESAVTPWNSDSAGAERQ